MVRLVHEPILPWKWLPAPEAHLGGLAVFCGVVRGVTGSTETLGIQYHAHEAMALTMMEDIAGVAETRFGAKTVMVHRLGDLAIGDTAVLCAAFTSHREAAFEACRFLIDTLKADVPIWKREQTREGSFWVEGDQRRQSE